MKIEQIINSSSYVVPAEENSLEYERKQPYGTGFVQNMWYFALPSGELKPGKFVSKTLLGEPILIGRDRKGSVFALRDICPHQGIPLTTGKFDGCEIQCCYHGWCFDIRGICTAIPALVEDQKINLGKIKTGSYPCREEQGNVWVFMGHRVDDLPDVPKAPGLGNLAYGKTTTTLLLPVHIDFAAVALIDTAHVPYVHKAWWWRSSRRVYEKRKVYVPCETGWTMLRHQPSKNSVLFRVFGKYFETEIGFRLPGCRIEHIMLNGRTLLSGISTLTPIDEMHTELNHTTYWTVPCVFPIVRPFVDYFVYEFLNQDREISAMQQIGLKHKPNLIMTVKDSGTPGHWYFLLKREWNKSREEGRPFVNPIKESVLRWRT